METFFQAGGASKPCATITISFDLKDEEKRTVEIGVDIWITDKGFKVSGEAAVDDPVSNQRMLRELADVVTTSLDECIATVQRYTTELCGYTTLLDELGVPRTKPS